MDEVYAHTVFYTLLEDDSLDTTWIYDKNITLNMHKEQCNTTDKPHIIISHPGRDGWPPEDETKYYTIRDGKLVIHKERTKGHFIDDMRDERNKQLQKLDGEFWINLESGKDNTDVLRRKQLLRDMPSHPVWDTCETLDDFRNVKITHLMDS